MQNKNMPWSTSECNFLLQIKPKVSEQWPAAPSGSTGNNMIILLLVAADGCFKILSPVSD